MPCCPSHRGLSALSNSRSDPNSVSSARASSTAERPRLPDPRSKASSSASDRACAPRSRTFSRGRSEIGQWRIDMARRVACAQRRQSEVLPWAGGGGKTGPIDGYSVIPSSRLRGRGGGHDNHSVVERDLSMQGKRILLGVTGGIAAYKSPDLVRRLRERGAEVQVVMTAAAREFVTPMTFQAVSGRTVRSDLWDAAAEAAMGHIELARWAHAVLIAPASADFLARLATGQADDLLATLCLATEAPIAVAPAMNHIMWANAATRANLGTLTQRGVQVFGPAEGDQACGEIGEGRMLEPLELAERVGALFSGSGALAGRRVLITAGPTRERIDPVRFISNRSSGKMGFAVAQAAREAGATVVLVCGPVSLPTPAGVRRVDVESAADMLAAVLTALPGTDI